MASEKVSLRIEKELLLMLMEKYGTDNQSEALRLAVVDCLSANDSPRLKTLFSYVGKKPPRIGKEVAEAFRQSGGSVFVDLFCGSLAMLCYLLWDVKVVVNDINKNLTNMYTLIRDQPSVFVSELMKLPYSEVLFQQFHEVPAFWQINDKAGESRSLLLRLLWGVSGTSGLSIVSVFHW